MKIVNWVKRNRSTILTCLGAAGMVGTVASAIIATPKAISKLRCTKGVKDLMGEDMTTVDVIEITAPYYIPTVILGTSTLVCIFGANALNKKDQAALTSAYALLNTAFDNYRKKLIDLHGEEVDDEVQNEVARETYNVHYPEIDTPDRKIIFYEPITDTKILRYERDVIDAEYHLNRNFSIGGEAPFNEWLDFLGIEQVPFGDKIGWDMEEGYYWIDFQHTFTTDDEGNQVCEIEYLFEPGKKYEDEYYIL